MSEILEAVEVQVPVRTAYDQWTQFETFPQFMDGVKSVRQLDDTTLEWVADVAGVVTFHRLAEGKSRVTLQLDVDPEGPVENVGDALGLVKGRVKGDMERFKTFIEARGTATGAWRGEVEQTTS
jgi:uncharacterized membrane protein